LRHWETISGGVLFLFFALLEVIRPNCRVGCNNTQPMRVGWAIKKNRSRANRLKKQPAKYEFRTQKIKIKKENWAAKV
jgi:hypothetical protein